MSMIIGVGILDSCGLVMFLPLLQLMNNPRTVKLEELGNLKFLVTALESIGIGLKLSSILIFLVVFFTVKGVVQYFSNLHQLKIKKTFINAVRVSLINSLNRISYKAFAKANVGKIQNALSGEVDRVARAYQAYLVAFQQLIFVLIYMVFAFFIEAKFALLITFGAVLTNLVYRQIYLRTIVTSRKLTSESNSFQDLLIQYTNNFKYIKATGWIASFGGKLKASGDLIEENNLRIGRLNAILSATREPLLVIIVCVVIYIQVYIFGGSLGPILISLLFFYRALAALLQMQSNYNFFLSISGSITNMAEFSDEMKINGEREGSQIIESFKGELELTNACVEFGSSIVLNGINLLIRNQETIAFVGESGSGKTTLVNILSGLIPLDSGKLRIGSIDRTELNVSSFQKRIGYITQEPVIFSDSVFNNITLWAEPNSMNRERFATAICRAAIDDFIYRLPEKENTRLGNNGFNLSGGQKQRISIARELYKDVDILIFDEATSALDAETEKAIQANIKELHGKYMLLVIAHRLSTVKHADRIVLMKKGEIIDQGNFEELIEKSAIFRQMVELQRF